MADANYIAKDAKPAELIGKRIEIPVHYDAWMRGARFGTITQFRDGKAGLSAFVYVKLDHKGIKRRLKLWRHDWEYAKVLA